MPSRDERIQAAKKLRKALQIALSSVQLDESDVEEIGSMFDPFDPAAKYKKGEICTYGGKTYVCLKTTKRGGNAGQGRQALGALRERGDGSDRPRGAQR